MSCSGTERAIGGPFILTAERPGGRARLSSPRCAPRRSPPKPSDMTGVWLHKRERCWLCLLIDSSRIMTKLKVTELDPEALARYLDATGGFTRRPLKSVAGAAKARRQRWPRRPLAWYHARTTGRTTLANQPLGSLIGPPIRPTENTLRRVALHVTTHLCPYKKVWRHRSSRRSSTLTIACSHTQSRPRSSRILPFRLFLALHLPTSCPFYVAMAAQITPSKQVSDVADSVAHALAHLGKPRD